MSILFLIPARGGSKGFPGKNVALLGGVPLVGLAARIALQASAILGSQARVVCSTDDETIAAAGREWGAEVPFMRPAELATDQAGSMDVVRHALDYLGRGPQTVVLLQPTSPLTTAHDVVEAVRLHQSSGDPVVSVTSEEHPPEWMYRMQEGRLVPVLPASVHQRQAAASAFRLNGAIYVASVAQLRETGSFVSDRTRGYVMPPERSVDIDTANDLERARQILGQQAPRGITVGPRRIGPGHPCFVIAEAGVNHNGSLEEARKLVDAAVRAGADAVKFQTFRAERLVTARAPKARYQLETTDAAESQLAMLKRMELDADAHRSLVDYCASAGILFLSTPFDEQSSDFLDGLGMPVFKLPSGELTNTPFLRHVARKRKPLILSTGMGNITEVARAVHAIRDEGNDDLMLLHCVSNYPTDPADANLRAMATLRDTFGVTAGFSDHTESDIAAMAAVALGASVIEKHITLDRSLPGPDQRVSMEPDAFATMIQRIRVVESTLGHGRKEPAAAELHVAGVARKSLVAGCDIPDGATLEPSMVEMLRPGTGLPPARLDALLGKRATRPIEKGTLLAMDMFA